MCPLGPGCHERSRGRLLRSLGAHSFYPECLENASVRLDPPTDSPEEPEIGAVLPRNTRRATTLLGTEVPRELGQTNKAGVC